MANFERARLCKTAEFDYFVPERKVLEEIEEGGLYIAMWSLTKVINKHGAAKVPLLVAEIDANKVIFNPFNTPDKPEELRLEFKIKSDNYVHADRVQIYGVKPKSGYLRDHHEGLDGPLPEVNISEKVTHKNHIRTEPIYA